MFLLDKTLIDNSLVHFNTLFFAYHTYAYLHFILTTLTFLIVSLLENALGCLKWNTFKFFDQEMSNFTSVLQPVPKYTLKTVRYKFTCKIVGCDMVTKQYFLNHHDAYIRESGLSWRDLYQKLYY